MDKCDIAKMYIMDKFNYCDKAKIYTMDEFNHNMKPTLTEMINEYMISNYTWKYIKCWKMKEKITKSKLKFIIQET